MKVSLFEQVPYRYLPDGFENQHSSAVTPPYDIVEPGRMQESLLSAYAELLHGARAGLDGVCVTEHSQSSYDMSPNPNLLASAVACAAQAEGTGSAGTLRDILRRDYAFVYLSWDGPRLVGRRVFDRYWELAEEMGRDANPYRLAFLQVVAVSETDERAEAEYRRHLEAHYRSGLGAIPGTAMSVPGYAEPAAIAGMLRSGGRGGMLSRMRTSARAHLGLDQ